ncbi:unnamed protein product [Pleuronectes platessa]|uniref:Uncharacterized protein n=1 Tax=Pleuronectes platessa TaxID=8262 RepID=A0A9N7W0A2_PLEPL|nr:unnamed protein product [Pleuronectes platessa]
MLLLRQLKLPLLPLRGCAGDLEARLTGAQSHKGFISARINRTLQPSAESTAAAATELCGHRKELVARQPTIRDNISSNTVGLVSGSEESPLGRGDQTSEEDVIQYSLGKY